MMTLFLFLILAVLCGLMICSLIVTLMYYLLPFIGVIFIIWLIVRCIKGKKK